MAATTPMQWLDLKSAAIEYGIPYGAMHAAVKSGDLKARNRAPKGVRWVTSREWVTEWLDRD